MRVKVKVTFITPSGLIAVPGSEVDIPSELGEYYFKEGSVEILPNCKGIQNVEVPEEVIEDAEKVASESVDKLVKPKKNK